MCIKRLGHQFTTWIICLKVYKFTSVPFLNFFVVLVKKILNTKI
jgi:hypothetical protein